MFPLFPCLPKALLENWMKNFYGIVLPVGAVTKCVVNFGVCVCLFVQLFGSCVSALAG